MELGTWAFPCCFRENSFFGTRFHFEERRGRICGMDKKVVVVVVESIDTQRR